MNAGLVIEDFLEHQGIEIGDDELYNSDMLISDVELFLAHHGVLGMHWGVRRARREARLARAGKEGSSVSSRARVLLTGRTGPIDLIRGRGIRGAARRKSIRESSREARLAAGKASVRDSLVQFGSTRTEDLIPVARRNSGKKGALDNDKLVLGLIGASFALRYLGRRAQKAGA